MRRERPRDSRAAEQRDELAPVQLIELHSVPLSARAGCRISNWQRLVGGYPSHFTTAPTFGVSSGSKSVIRPYPRDVRIIPCKRTSARRRRWSQKCQEATYAAQQTKHPADDAAGTGVVASPSDDTTGPLPAPTKPLGAPPPSTR